MHRFQPIVAFILFLFLLFLCVPHTFASTTNDTLIRYWKFDESTGNASDSSGDSSAITNNNVTYSAGQKNNAAVFNGTNSYFSGTGPNLANSSFTISAWIYANNLSTDQVWFDLGSSSTTDKSLHMRLTTGGALKMGFFLDDLQTADGVISAGSWYQVIYTYNSTTRARTIYINGTSRGSNTAGANFSGDTTMTIGSWGSFERWNGKIDDVKIYNRVLTAGEIADLAAGNPTTATWTGAASTDPENAGNWDIGVVPDLYSKLVIADVTTQPLATANMLATGLTINANAFFDLSTYDFTLNDSGTFSNNGTLALANTQNLTNFANDTDSGTILIHPTTDTSGFKTGSTYNNIVINDGLVGYWKFDELSTGTIATDSSGYVNDVKTAGSSGPNNKPQPSTSVPSVKFVDTRSLQFDGTDDMLYMDSYNNMPQSNLTICTWVKTSSTAQQSIAIGNRTPSLFNSMWVFEIGTNGKLLFWDYDSYAIYGFDQSTYSNHVVNDGNWHHVCFVKSGTSGTYYLDGAADGTKTAAVDIAYWSTGISFGADYRDNARYLSGNLDDARLYKRSLSAGEIARLASGELPNTSYTNTQMDNLTVNGNFVLNSGTASPNTPNSTWNMNLKGNFENNGGVFNARSGTITLNGTSQTITSSNTFYALTKTVTSADTLTFAQNSISTISATLNLTGASFNLLALRSSQPGTQFKIDPQGTRTFSYLNPQDSYNINGTLIAYDGTFLYGSNLSNWIQINPNPPPASNSSTSSSNSPPASCDNIAPNATPNLFEIKTSPTSATLYFTPVTPSNGYVISYGTSTNAEQYAVAFSYSDTSGAIPYTINSLNENTTYYFKVKGVNGCKSGNWSQIVSNGTHREQTSSTISSVAEPSKSPVPEQEHQILPTPPLRIRKTELSPTITKTQTQSAKPKTDYILAIKVENKGLPVSGAVVELHSVPRKTVTDKNGVARFTNVEGGEHTVAVAYNGFSGQDKIMVEGDKKDISINIALQPQYGIFSPLMIVTAFLILLVVIVVLVYLLYGKRNHRN